MRQRLLYTLLIMALLFFLFACSTPTEPPKVTQVYRVDSEPLNEIEMVLEFDEAGWEEIDADLAALDDLALS